jgi:hypothetical protein
MLDDLKKTFDNLHKYKMILNPKKMCFWCIISKPARLYGIIPGDRCEPEEGGCHRIIAAILD